MSLLFPLYLLGAAAIAAPIILHLTRKMPKDKIPFSSLMFLEETPLRLNKRSRLEHVFLLLLRCLALLGIAFLFARPFGSGGEGLNQESEQVVFVLDASASMRRGDLWKQAKAVLEKEWKSLSESDRAALVVMGDRLESRIGFKEWEQEKARAAELLRERLDGLEPGWRATPTGEALVRASELLAEDEADTGGGFTRRRVVLISDLQEGSELESVQGHGWSRGLTFELRRLTADLSSNASVHPVVSLEDLKLGGEAPRPMLRVSNHKPSDTEQFTLRWGADEQTAAVSITVPAGQSRVVQAPPRPAGSAGRLLTLSGDASDFDNQVHVAPVLERQVNILFIGDTDPNDPDLPLFYLQRGLQRTRQLNPVITAKSPQASLDGLDFDAVDFLVLAAGDAGTQQPKIREWLHAGGAALYLCLEGDRGALLSELLGAQGLALEEGAPANYAMLAGLDFEAPLLKPFDDPEYADFSNIHFWKYRRLASAALPDAQIFARFDSGDPAWLSTPAGQGILFVFASGWHPGDSQLALSSKFIPMLYVLLETGRRAVSTEPELFFTGDAIPLPAGVEMVILPDGQEFPVEPGAEQFSGTVRPGIYQLVSPERVLPVAVNLPPDESRTTPLSQDQLDAVGLPLGAPADVEAPETTGPEKMKLQDEEQEGRQKLWRWLILGVWGILLLETGLSAGRLQAAAPAKETS